MSPARTQAYRRVIQTLTELGPSKLQPAEQDRIRIAADNLIFSRDLSRDVAAHEALEDIGRLCRALVESGRWMNGTADRLAADVRACGPEAASESQPELALRAA